MREKVCIILNEREPEKQKAVSKILELLKKQNITASRLEITEKIADLVNLKSPQILIMDYLLGDYSTGLDILSSINKLPENNKPRVFFLTDEPSVKVAVQALKMGAENYYLLESKDAIPLLIEEINCCLKKKELSPVKKSSRPLKLNELTAGSSETQAVINQALSLVRKKVDIIFIYAAQGCGSSTLAESIHYENNPLCTSRVVDLRYCNDKAGEIFAYPPSYKSRLRCSLNFNLTLDHCEEDQGEILDHLTLHRKPIFTNSTISSPLIAISTDKKTMLAWKKSLKCDVIEIPPLSERNKDIIPLAHNFIDQAEKYTESKIKVFTPAVLKEIAAMEWEGNIAQLKSVIIDCAIESTFSSTDVLQLIQSKKSKWSALNCAQAERDISPFSAAMTLQASNHNYRIAAVRLGCSISSLQNILNNYSAEHEQ